MMTTQDWEDLHKKINRFVKVTLTILFILLAIKYVPDIESMDAEGRKDPDSYSTSASDNIKVATADKVIESPTATDSIEASSTQTEPVVSHEPTGVNPGQIAAEYVERYRNEFAEKYGFDLESVVKLENYQLICHESWEIYEDYGLADEYGNRYLIRVMEDQLSPDLDSATLTLADTGIEDEMWLDGNSIPAEEYIVITEEAYNAAVSAQQDKNYIKAKENIGG